MAATGFFHHIGTFLLFAASILLLITTISSPIVDRVALLRVDLGNATSNHQSALTFGTFGYCMINTADDNHDFCTSRAIGYDPAAVMKGTDQTVFSKTIAVSTRALTKVMVLHPVATGIAFVAFLLALGAGFIGSLLASLVALVAFVITAVVLITDLVLFATVRNDVNDDKDDHSGAHAHFGVAMWTLVAATACLLLGTIIVFFTCCSSRMHRRSARASKADPYVGASRRRGWF